MEQIGFQAYPENIYKSDPWNKGKKTGLVPKTAFKKGIVPWNKGLGIKTFCLDCGVEKKTNRSKRCNSCSSKNRDLSNFLKAGKIAGIGKIPWSKGTKGLMKSWCKGLTKETSPIVAKIAEARRGKHHSLEVKKKMSLNRIGKNSGESNHNWKGGVSSINMKERVKFRQTMQKLVLKRDNYTCQLCGETKVELQVDHIQPWSEYVELRFKMENCRTLCKLCHYEITYGKPMTLNKPWGKNFITIQKGR